MKEVTTDFRINDRVKFCYWGYAHGPVEIVGRLDAIENEVAYVSVEPGYRHLIPPNELALPGVAFTLCENLEVCNG